MDGDREDGEVAREGGLVAEEGGACGEGGAAHHHGVVGIDPMSSSTVRYDSSTTYLTKKAYADAYRQRSR